LSHRSGETEDTFIADLAVVDRAGQSEDWIGLRAPIGHANTINVLPSEAHLAHLRVFPRRSILS